MGLNSGSRFCAISSVLVRYCLEAVQRPLQPSERRKLPAPLRPESWPELVTLTPLAALPRAEAAPLGLTRPLTIPSPMIRPLETTTAPVVEPPHPTETTTQAPSKLPPPPERDVVRRGSLSCGLLRRADRSGSTERGSGREPDSDLSSLPMLPPALPCASAIVGAVTRKETRRAAMV